MQGDHPEILEVREANLSQAASDAAAALRRGALVVLPTDTVYGVAAHPAEPDAVARLYKAKQRPADKPIPLLAGDVKALQRFKAHMGPTGRALAARYWPGPLTLVLPTPQGFEGFRIPADRVALAVLRAVRNVLRVTSANLSGDPPAMDAGEAVLSLGPSVDLVLDAGRASGGQASTVVKVDRAGQVSMLREGAVPRADIREVCRSASKPAGRAQGI